MLDHNTPVQALWSGPRIGSSRWQQQEHAGQPKQSSVRSVPQNTASMSQAAPADATKQRFNPHNLQLKPGDVVSGVSLDNTSSSSSGTAALSNSSSSSSSSSSGGGAYVLDSEIHRGPRSAVWRATDKDSNNPVVLKVLGLNSQDQRSAAVKELEIMQQLTGCLPAQGASSNNGGNQSTQAAAAVDIASDSNDSSGSAGLQGHVVRLLGSFLLQQKATPTERQQQELEQLDVPAMVGAVAADSSSRSGVVLVMPQLHQSLSWVLHFVHQRNGRMGLPPAAVRNYAHQLLTSLAELHDQHAVVHRDVTPSNTLLQQPFVVRTGKKHMMRSMTLQELCTAQWALIDLGNAGRLLPPAAAAQDTSQEPNSHLPTGKHQQQQQQQQQQGVGPMQWISQLLDRFQGKIPESRRFKVAADTPSGQLWQVAAGDMQGYESVPYVPPEAILHCPSTAAHDIWSAACSIYEAATGRVLFPVEAAAAARRSITNTVYRPSADDDVSTQLDEVHLALIKGISGPPPEHVLSRSSVAEELFADTQTGRLWLSEEEEEVPELKGWRQKASKPLLHHLMAKRNMTLQQAVDLADMLQPMLAWDPAERPTAAELLHHPYFKTF